MATSESAERQPVWRIPNDLRLRLLAALSSNPDGCPKMTYDEFLEWADEDTLAEWVDGEVVIMPSPVSMRHQDITNFLFGVFTGYARLHDLGKVLNGPFQMKLESSGREPDVLFVTTAHLSQLRPTYLQGPADLVVEIISPESIARDRGDKFAEYEKADIPEYWLIDPEAKRAEFYLLDEAGVYRPAQLDADGVYRSRVLPGLWLRVEWLWQEPLPNVDDVLYEVAGDMYAQYQMERLRQRGYLRRNGQE